MKSLKRSKLTKFIALILALAMVISVLYLGDRDKVALADPQLSYDLPELTFSSEEEITEKTERYYFADSEVTVNLPQIKIGENVSTDYFWATGGETPTEITTISPSKNGTSVTLYKKTVTGEGENLTTDYSSKGYTINVIQAFDSAGCVSTSDSGILSYTTNPALSDFDDDDDDAYIGKLEACIKKGNEAPQEGDYKPWIGTDSSFARAIDGINQDNTSTADGTYTVYTRYTIGGNSKTSELQVKRTKFPLNFSSVSISGSDYLSNGELSLENIGTRNANGYTYNVVLETTTTDSFDLILSFSNKARTEYSQVSSEDAGLTYKLEIPSVHSDITSKSFSDIVFYDGNTSGADIAPLTLNITVNYISGQPSLDVTDISLSDDSKGQVISTGEGDEQTSTIYVNDKDAGIKTTSKVTINQPYTITGISFNTGTESNNITVPEVNKNDNRNEYTLTNFPLPISDTDPGTEKVYELVATGSTGLKAKSDPVKVVYDPTAPIISDFSVTQAETTQTIASGEHAANKITKMQDYTIKFKVEDVTLDRVTVTADPNVTISEPTVNEGYYTYNITAPGQTFTALSNVFTVKAVDRAKNESAEQTYIIDYYDETVNVSPAIFKDKAEAESYTGTPTKDNELYVAVTVTTKVELASIDYITVDSSAAPDATVERLTGLDSVSTSPDEDGNYISKFIYKVTFSKSSNLSENAVRFTATNKNGATGTGDAGVFYVDLNDPSFNVTEDKGTTSGINDSNTHTWYKSVMLRVVAKDDPESGATYASGVSKITVVEDGTTKTFTDTSFVEYDVKESASFAGGTPISISLVDKSGRTATPYNKTFYVDKTAPEASLSIDGKSPDAVRGTTIDGNPTIAYSGKDKLNFAYYQADITKPDGQVTTKKLTEVKNVNESLSLSDFIGGVAVDGTYSVSIKAVDFANNAIDPNPITTSFILDNTKPVNDITIANSKPAKFDKYNRAYSNPETGVSYEYGQYYAETVTLNLKVVDDNIDRIKVTDNGSEKNVSWSEAKEGNKTVHTGRLTVGSEGDHTVTISAVDKAGFESLARAVTFSVDNNAPTISVSLNGSTISAGSGVRYLNTNGNVVVTSNDKYFDADDFTRIVKRTTPDKAVNNSTDNISNGSTTYNIDADYEISYKVVDRAGRESTYGPIQFRVDKVAPKLEVSGAAMGGTARTNVNAVMSILEDFYWDMTSVSAKIYKKVDGQGERLFEDVKVNPTSARTAITKALTEDGEYRFEMEATDKCGNHSTLTYSFLVDANAPLIELSGVKNYDSTDKAVDLIVKVTEDFYTSNKLYISGTRTDIDGKSEKLNFSGYNVNASRVSTIPQQFKEDGIYDINVRSVDKVGNEGTQKVHFTIDSKAPIIKDLSEYDNALMKKFEWKYKTDDIVKDLTVCDVSILLDGVEYDGNTELSDGSHTLRIEAVDELGHESSSEYSFLVDTKAPTILVSGVEDGDRLEEERQINISLQLDEDMLRSVVLNGKNIEISNNVSNLTINEKGDYELVITAVDKAGNESTTTLHFSFGKQTNWWWLILLICGILLLLILGIVVYRNRWNQKKGESAA